MCVGGIKSHRSRHGENFQTKGKVYGSHPSLPPSAQFFIHILPFNEDVKEKPHFLRCSHATPVPMFTLFPLPRIQIGRFVISKKNWRQNSRRSRSSIMTVLALIMKGLFLGVIKAISPIWNPDRLSANPNFRVVWMRWSTGIIKYMRLEWELGYRYQVP